MNTNEKGLTKLEWVLIVALIVVLVAVALPQIH
jgi:Flp pilus assembly pilin Flp